MRTQRWIIAMVQTLLAASAGVLAAAESRPASPEQFNYVLGTQTFCPAYQFTDKPRLLETAERIRAMGATVVKFELSNRYAGPNGNVPAADPAIRSLADLVRLEPTHRQVLEMPFRDYVLWAHSFTAGEYKWRRGLSQDDAEAEYREIHALVAYLLKTYSGTGKTFYLGHWEGDGWLRGSVAPENDAKATPAAVQGMTDWLNVRQRAVDDAKRDTPHEDVQVWHYTEVNHVRLAMDENRPAMVNLVLPNAPVDFVSYSCYDTQADAALLERALDYIESKLAAKPGIVGKRVFLGEYGFPSILHSAAEQDALSRRVMETGLRWGCPFVLYWEFYNNEVEPGGRQRGFWMVDDRDRPQPVYQTHRQFYAAMRRFVGQFQQQQGRLPNRAEFGEAALGVLQALPPAR